MTLPIRRFVRVAIVCVLLSGCGTELEADPDGADAYPIVSFSWLLLKERYTDQVKAQALKRFVNWGLQEGQQMSSELGFIRLPSDVVTRSQAALSRVN